MAGFCSVSIVVERESQDPRIPGFCSISIRREIWQISVACQLLLLPLRICSQKEKVILLPTPWPTWSCVGVTLSWWLAHHSAQ